MTRRTPGGRRRRVEPADDGVAMIMVLMTMLIAAMLLTAVLGAITAELLPTVHQRKSALTIAAAQAGQGEATSRLRSAYGEVSGVGVIGDPSKLPCATAASPITGTLAGATGLGYSTQIAYFAQDPSGRSATWRAANALTCTSGRGTSTVPLYALISSSAVARGSFGLGDQVGNRSVESVYTFTRTDQNMVGGPISPWVDRGLCWQAGAMPPVAGSVVTLAACRPGSPLQKFSYRTDYTLALTDTQPADQSSGMCLTAASSYTRLEFQPCGPLGWNRAAPTNTVQRWSYNDNGKFQGIDAAATGLSSASCLSDRGVHTAGQPISIQACGSGNKWVPDASVGAGAAGAATSQLINFAEYGRCLDVTNQNVNITYLIAYPCKQDPTKAITWNQRWVWDGAASRQLQTTYSGNLYCLDSPGTNLGRVVVRRCSNGQASMRWRVATDTGVRSTSYTVTDTNGLCLSLGRPDAALPNWSTIAVETCNGTARQKWNAPPQASHGGLGSERETTTG